MIRALLATARRILFGPVIGEDTSLSYARMYGELSTSFINARDSSNAYILARRAGHHAIKYLGQS